jgi:hypothetical protein
MSKKKQLGCDYNIDKKRIADKYIPFPKDLSNIVVEYFYEKWYKIKLKEKCSWSDDKKFEEDCYIIKIDDDEILIYDKPRKIMNYIELGIFWNKKFGDQCIDIVKYRKLSQEERKKYRKIEYHHFYVIPHRYPLLEDEVRYENTDDISIMYSKKQYELDKKKEEEELKREEKKKKEWEEYIKLHPPKTELIIERIYVDPFGNKYLYRKVKKI